ncbi:hypothetical protein Glove_217g190 [Diversispora epigaea]|uniref:HCP-like protein n=1 Tax=Diversispora epigaea TaxID=1348612 RepID=A0A397IQD9_9GLOM|nr:hypothetical protein Glove_217g190 [Diversispora epigaea]
MQRMWFRSFCDIRILISAHIKDDHLKKKLLVDCQTIRKYIRRDYSKNLEVTLQAFTTLFEICLWILKLISWMAHHARKTNLNTYVQANEEPQLNHPPFFDVTTESSITIFVYWYDRIFYKHGIGTVADNKMDFKFFNLAANEIIDTSSNSSHLRKLNNDNKEIGIISLANMYLYLDGIGVEKDTKKAFRIFYKFVDKGSLIALNSVAYCYHLGVDIERNEEKAFELYLKSAKKGIILAQSNVGICYEFAKGTKKDEVQGFQWYTRVALSESINAMLFVVFCYENGIGVGKDEKEAFKWFLKADIMKNRCGTKKDILNDIHWLNKAKENWNIDADELLEEIISYGYLR